jgi:hypothetical protein
MNESVLLFPLVLGVFAYIVFMVYSMYHLLYYFKERGKCQAELTHS